MRYVLFDDVGGDFYFIQRRDFRNRIALLYPLADLGVLGRDVAVERAMIVCLSIWSFNRLTVACWKATWALAWAICSLRGPSTAS